MVDVAETCARMLAAEPPGAAPPGGESLRLRTTTSPVVFLVELPDRTVVAKLPAPDRPGSALVEAWAYRAVAELGVRVPAVLGVQDDPECVVVEALSGSSLWSGDRPAGIDATCWAQAGEDLRAVHEVRLPAYGPLVHTREDGVRGEAATWCPFARFTREEGIERLVRAGHLEPWAGRRLERRLDDAAEALHGWTDGRLLHGDLEGGHLFVAPDGRYQAMIDFGQAQVGDPRWDLARVRLWDGEEALDALLDGYGRDILTTDERQELLPLYLLAFVIPHAAQLAAVGAHAQRR